MLGISSASLQRSWAFLMNNARLGDLNDVLNANVQVLAMAFRYFHTTCPGYPARPSMAHFGDFRRIGHFVEGADSDGARR